MKDINQTPFAYDAEDPFDVQVQGICLMRGRTQFGAPLFESDGEYEIVKALQDLSREEETTVPQT